MSEIFQVKNSILMITSQIQAVSPGSYMVIFCINNYCNDQSETLHVHGFLDLYIFFLSSKCVLVQPFMSRTSWGFPKGKVNKDESAFDCAIREVNMNLFSKLQNILAAKDLSLVSNFVEEH